MATKKLGLTFCVYIEAKNGGVDDNDLRVLDILKDILETCSNSRRYIASPSITYITY